MMSGPSAVSRRQFGLVAGSVSQTHRDITDDRYRDLRKPRRIHFFCNGDRYFKGKKMFITPHRYLTFNDLLNDLTGKLPSSIHLPYGVRTIYSPVGGSKIKNIDSLQDGENYVVAGFENFRSIKYGENKISPWSHAKPATVDDPILRRPNSASPSQISNHAGRPNNTEIYTNDFNNANINKGGYGAFQPRRPIRQSNASIRKPVISNITNVSRPLTGPKKGSLNLMKPRMITVVRHSQNSPHTNVKILLNRQTAQSYEQMMKDISEAFGPKWKNNKVQKLFTLKGKEVLGVNEFFREDDVFIAVGNTPLTSRDLSEVVKEVYADHPNAKNVLNELEKQKRRAAFTRARDDDGKDDATTGSKRDSGFGSDSSNRDEGEREDHATVNSERQRIAGQNRDRAYKKMQKKLAIDQQSNDEEKKRNTLLPLIHEKASYRRQQDKEKEDRRVEKSPARYRLRRETPRRKEEAQVIVVVKEGSEKKASKEKQLGSEDGYETDEDVSQVGPHKSKRIPSSIAGSVPETNEREDDQEERRLSEERAEHEKAERDVKELEREEAEKEKRLKEERGEAEKAREEEERKKREEDERERKELEERKSKEDAEIKKQLEKKEKERQKKEKVDKERVEKERKERVEKERKERLEKERKEKEQKEREVREEKEREEKSRKENEQKIMKDKGAKGVLERQAKERKQLSSLKKQTVGKTKLERQISNLSHVFDKYELGNILGDGNFAIVKQCKLKNKPGPGFAMKIIDKSKLKGKEHMIENEIEIMRLCGQPNIVKLIEEFETKDEIYLIMELVKGGDLFDAITQSVKFPEDVAAHMVFNVTKALFYLHSRCIVHRDLKPENLLVCRNRDGPITLKLTDFGLAMEVVEPIFTVCGTPTYVAPEILSEIGYGLEVDMWAVGVITYILLCGFPPFRSPDRNQTELFEFIKAGEFEFLSPYWDSVSKGAKDLISRLLVVNKGKRFTAVETLCHPWIISKAGTWSPPGGMDEFRRNLRRDLDMQGKLNRESYLKNKR